MSGVVKYRKKPVTIEAMHFSGNLTRPQVEAIARWCEGSFQYDRQQPEKTYYWAIYLRTLEGTTRASLNDYIIKGVEGEFYPCKPEIFKKTYEAVEPS